jgi:surface protein
MSNTDYSNTTYALRKSARTLNAFSSFNSTKKIQGPTDGTPSSVITDMRIGQISDIVNGRVVSDGVSPYPLPAVVPVPPAPPVPPSPMIIIINTNLGGDDIQLPFGGIGVDGIVVDWGDGNTQTFLSGSVTHTYSMKGIYTIQITGSATSFGNLFYIGSNLITSVTSWGDFQFTSLSGAFFNATNLTTVPNDIPSTVTNTSYMFYGATSFNQDIGGWNVGNVTNMEGMFNNATVFNRDIGGWNVSNVTDMGGMFQSASSFNQPIGGWNVGNVTNMEGMFNTATLFNQPIGNWIVSNVTNMREMFSGATTFNQYIGSWDVSKVTRMDFMFNIATSFNQQIGGWNVSNVTSMENMFYYTTSFNQNIGNWIVSNVTNMREMFNNASLFLQDLSTWNPIVISVASFMFNNCPMCNYDSPTYSYYPSFPAALLASHPKGSLYYGTC